MRLYTIHSNFSLASFIGQLREISEESSFRANSQVIIKESARMRTAGGYKDVHHQALGHRKVIFRSKYICMPYSFLNLNKKNVLYR